MFYIRVFLSHATYLDEKAQKNEKNFSYKCVLELNFAAINGQVVKIFVP
jgi:hypothetical protein